MPTWYEAFGRWATTCKSVDGCNIGAEQKHHPSFISHLHGWVWSNDIEREMCGIECETAVILVLTHGMLHLTVLAPKMQDSGPFNRP